MNEIRSGTYIFNDKNTIVSGGCTLNECAAFLLTTVISVAKNGQVILDIGSKAIGLDPLAGSGEQSYGYILEAPEACFFRMNEEHGYVDIRRAERRFQVGDQIRIIPNHICVAVNLQEEAYGFRGDSVEPQERACGHRSRRPLLEAVPRRSSTSSRKAIDATRQDLAGTRTELSGSIASTHEELIALERKGERKYYEFDLDKSKQFSSQVPGGHSSEEGRT